MVIDYQDESFENPLQGCDAALDTMSGESCESFKIPKKGGLTYSLFERSDGGFGSLFGVGQ